MTLDKETKQGLKEGFQYRLLKALAEKGMTAAELSRATGIPKPAIHNYLTGKYVAKQDKCYFLAKALGVDPGWLMLGEEPLKQKRYLNEPPKTMEAKIISDSIDQMPPEERRRALYFLREIFRDNPDLFKE